MVLLLVVTLSSVVSLAAAAVRYSEGTGFCPQIAFNTRNDYERAINVDRYDLTWWFRNGADVVGNSTGAKPAPIGVGQSLTSTTAFANIASAQDLFNNGDQVFIIGASIAAGATVNASCLIQLGTAKTVCFNRNGTVTVSNRFGLVPQAAPVAADKTVVLTVRRHLANRIDAASGIQIDFEQSSFFGTTHVRADSSNSLRNLPDSVWGFDAGLTIRGPVQAGETNTVEQVFVLEGRDNRVPNASVGTLPSFLLTELETGADAPVGTGCAFAEWVTGTPQQPFVVPGSGANNLRLRYVRRNFGPTVLAAETEPFAYVSSNLGFVSNFTQVNVSSGSTLLANNQVQWGALNAGDTQDLTFTATVFNCTPTGNGTVRGERLEGGIDVATNDAVLHVLRRSKLQFIVRDTRPFDLVDLPIAAGCDVPLTYTVDVRNLGPSCVEDLDLRTEQEDILSCTNTAAGRSSLPNIQAAQILPGELRTGLPVAFVIEAFANAGNEQLNNRSINIVSPLDGGLSSDQHPLHFYSFVRQHSIQTLPDQNLLNLTYDVSRYGDLQVQFEWENDGAVTSGEFAADGPNLGGQLSIKNAGCVRVDDIDVLLKIELPRGGWYFDVHGRALNGDVASGFPQRFATIERLLRVPSLAPGEVATFDLDFAVCQITKATAAGLNVMAYVLRAGGTLFEGEQTQYEQNVPTNDFFNERDEARNTINRAIECSRIVPVRPFDDKIDEYPAIGLEAVLTTKLTCTAPVLTTTSDLALGGLDNSETSESSSSSSSSTESVADVDLLKLTRCRVNVTNAGSSDVSIKVDINWVLPSGTRLVRWASPNNDHNQFVLSNGGGVWALVARSTLDGPLFRECPLRDTAPNVLEFDFASTRPGEIQVVARVDKSATVATFEASTFGGAQTVVV